jgi:hypothetical protein
MNEVEREKIKVYIQDHSDEIERGLNQILRNHLESIGINPKDLNALSQAQETFFKWMRGE